MREPRREIDYPGVFVEHAIGFDTLGARVGWAFPQGEFELRLDDVTFSNADLAGTANGRYRGGETGAKGIDLTAPVQPRRTESTSTNTFRISALSRPSG